MEDNALQTRGELSISDNSESHLLNVTMYE